MELTKRQFEIMQYLQFGLTITEIMHYLHLKRSTVYNHISVVKSKYGAKSIAHAVSIFCDKVEKSAKTS